MWFTADNREREERDVSSGTTRLVYGARQGGFFAVDDDRGRQSGGATVSRQADVETPATTVTAARPVRGGTIVRMAMAATRTTKSAAGLTRGSGVDSSDARRRRQQRTKVVAMRETHSDPTSVEMWFTADNREKEERDVSSGIVRLDWFTVHGKGVFFAVDDDRGRWNGAAAVSRQAAVETPVTVVMPARPFRGGTMVRMTMAAAWTTNSAAGLTRGSGVDSGDAWRRGQRRTKVVAMRETHNGVRWMGAKPVRMALVKEIAGLSCF
ncbi:hypothetical protein L1987_29905 [Smallanthus sonchifolius]|uniref:Uncharacterized protein n=1 Tax=Smallanthus sonchifolius TaxID=185202 RepID=A0ACB9I2S4_9ASTR|nr:hypothetical protein L1987_29905 [Smallanthus sonchifolius]